MHVSAFDTGGCDFFVAPPAFLAHPRSYVRFYLLSRARYCGEDSYSPLAPHRRNTEVTSHFYTPTFRGRNIQSEIETFVNISSFCITRARSYMLLLCTFLRESY